LVVYHKDKKVVDLWGKSGNTSYSADSISGIWSSTKPVASILIGIMVDKGLLNYEEKICKYWPEFGKNGKENITLK